MAMSLQLHLLLLWLALYQVAGKSSKGDDETSVLVKSRREDCLAINSNRRQLSSGDTKDIVKKLTEYEETCPGGTVDTFFNFHIDLDYSKSTKGNREKCDERDRFIMGAIITDLIYEIECEIPEHPDELFEAELCETPEEAVGDPISDQTTRKLVRVAGFSSYRSLEETKKTRKRWAYKGRGRCKRCKKKNDDRRLLRALGSSDDEEKKAQKAKEEAEKKERERLEKERKEREKLEKKMKELEKKGGDKEEWYGEQIAGIDFDEICSISKDLDVEAKLAQSASKHATLHYKELLKFANTGAYHDQKGLDKVCDKASEALEICQDQAKIAKESAKEVEKSCEKLTERDPQMKNEHKYKLLVDLGDNGPTCIEAAKAARESFHTVKDLKYKILEGQVEKKYDDKLKNLKGIASEIKDEIEEREDLLKDEIHELKDEEKKTKDEERKKELQKQIKYLEEEKKRLKEERLGTESVLKEDAKRHENVDLARLAVGRANSANEWLSEFVELLETEVPVRLFELYNATEKNFPGCLDYYPDVEVQLEEIAYMEDLLPIDECELDYPYVPLSFYD